MQTFWEVNLCCWDSDSRRFGKILINKSQQDALFLNFILVKNSTCFGQTYCPSSGILKLFTANFKSVSEEKFVHFLGNYKIQESIIFETYSLLWIF
jgi:hypothetical protein